MLRMVYNFSLDLLRQKRKIFRSITASSKVNQTNIQLLSTLDQSRSNEREH